MGMSTSIQILYAGAALSLSATPFHRPVVLVVLVVLKPRVETHPGVSVSMARLILQDGSEYWGQPFGARKSRPGEVGKG